MNDYWLELKYYMSGLKLLAEMSYMSPGNGEVILDLWLQEKEEDQLKSEMRRIIKTGIRQDWDVRYMMHCMIKAIPKEKWYEMDSKGYTFLPCNPEDIVEHIYCENKHKNRLRRVYEGLYPGVDEYGQSFADLNYGFESTGNIRMLEDEFSRGSFRAWENVVSQEKDGELVVLSTGLSKGGRHQLLAGLRRERVPGIVMETILCGPKVHERADQIAETMLNKWREFV